MKKVRLLLVLASLFIGFNGYADEEQGQQKVYILYRDSNGEMVTSIYDPMLFTLKTGHVAFYIVPEKGEPYIVDAMPNIGVTHRTLHDFQGDGKQIWAFDPELTPEQTKAIIGWLKSRVGIDSETGEPKYPFAWDNWENGIYQKGPNEYDCVGLVEVWQAIG